jgi:hypothetical protein
MHTPSSLKVETPQKFPRIFLGPEKVKIFYCPVFPTSKIVLSFCLTNSIVFEAAKIDHLHGDFKEDPILVDNDINICGRYAIF